MKESELDTWVCQSIPQIQLLELSHSFPPTKPRSGLKLNYMPLESMLYFLKALNQNLTVACESTEEALALYPTAPHI